jgi:hypothetical protein
MAKRWSQTLGPAARSGDRNRKGQCRGCVKTAWGTPGQHVRLPVRQAVSGLDVAVSNLLHGQVLGHDVRIG